MIKAYKRYQTIPTWPSRQSELIIAGIPIQLASQQIAMQAEINDLRTALSNIEAMREIASCGVNALSDEFNAWWDADKYMDTNPFKEGSYAFWALEGWHAGIMSERDKSEAVFLENK
jgi:hypothetical protein